MPVKSLENLLNPNDNGELGDLVKRARDVGELTERLKASLPTDLSAGIEAANVRESGELVVLAASPAWAAKLRFEEDRILAAMTESNPDVTACSVRVNRD